MAPASLIVDRNIIIDGSELVERFVHASGPGGQNINKVSSAVQLRFDIAGSPSLTARVKANALRIAGRRATKDGMLVIEASRFRTQERNRVDARERLKALILEAAKPPSKPRKRTKPSRGAIERRLKAKAGRAAVKRMRGKIGEE